MRTVFLRTLRSQLQRTVMTSVAVVIGVALIAGTLIFTDTINRSFDEIGAGTYRGVSAVVTPIGAEGLPTTTGSSVPTLPEALRTRVAMVDGVQDAVGQVRGTTLVFEPDGRTRLGGQSSVWQVSSAPPSGFGDVEYVAGRAPRTADEVAVDARMAEDAGVRVGQTISVQGEGPRQPLRLVGLSRIGTGDTPFGAATIAFTTTTRAAELLGRTPDRYYGEILVRGRPGAVDEQVAQRIQAAIGDAGMVRTGAAQATKQADDIRTAVSFLPTMLLVFAGIATFVGAFLIFNTFSITVAQRQRELALLRALGASRRQVRRLVSGEALVVGLVGAVLGMLAGLVVAPALRVTVRAFGADVPAGTVFSVRTLLISLAVGVLVTLLGSHLPARRATKVAPLEALRDASLPSARGELSRRPILVGVAIGALGVATLLLGALGAVDGNAGTALAGGGAGLLFVATMLISPALVGPLAALVGRPLERVFGIPGRLARDNAARQPARTAVTAGALMIGLALVVFATVLAAGLRETMRDGLGKLVSAPVVLQDSDGGNVAMARGVVAAAAGTDGTVRAGGIGVGRLRVGTQTVAVTAPDAMLLEDGLVRIDRAAGTPGPPGPVGDPGVGRVYLTEALAGGLGLEVGDRFTARAANGHRGSLEVDGIVEGTGRIVAGVVMTERTARSFGISQPRYAVVEGDRAKLRAGLAADYPAVAVLTTDGWIANQTGQVDQLLGLIYGLLGLSVIVALFGIVNTLTLSIKERGREIGLLRAVGATQGQVRRMVLLEAAITALLGAGLGAVLGFVLGAGVVATLDGVTISVPVGRILLLVLVAVGLGVLAAVRPARRAARLDMLQAIAGR